MATSGSSAGGKSKFRSSVVVGKARPVTPKTPAPGATYATPAYAPPTSPSYGSGDFRTPTTPGFSTRGVFGAALVLLCIAGIVVNFTSPWERTDTGIGDPETSNRDDLKTEADATPSPYDDRLTSWPLLGYIMGIILGVALVVFDLVPMWRGVQRILQAVALLGVAYFGFLVGLTAARMFGLYFAFLMSETGEASYHLHVVPYVNLVSGLGLMIIALRILQATMAYFTNQPDRGRLGRHALRTPAWTALAACATLLLLPLLPFLAADTAGAGGDGKFYLHEGFMALFADGGFGVDENLKDAAEDLGVARGMLWVVLYVSLATLAMGLVERSGALPLLWGTFTQAYVLNVVPIVVGIIFTIMMYVDISSIEDEEVGVAFNYFLPVAYAGLIALFVLFLLRVTMPFFAATRVPGGPMAPTP